MGFHGTKDFYTAQKTIISVKRQRSYMSDKWLISRIYNKLYGRKTRSSIKIGTVELDTDFSNKDT